LILKWSILVRAAFYAVLFIGLVLVFVPARILWWSGIARPRETGLTQAGGLLVALVGLAIALWCLYVFARAGRGTPAPFDPPRRLVTRGPYGLVRNPMYIGAGLALGGAALFYGSLHLLGYTVLFFFASHLFIVFYEEPVLRGTFGEDYVTYCRRVRRWLPGGAKTAAGKVTGKRGSLPE
jgi:protein-S-isoprenylcysteine O-methyltransferase Ste14